MARVIIFERLCNLDQEDMNIKNIDNSLNMLAKEQFLVLVDNKEYIFLSHSQRDIELVEFFEKAIKRIGLEVVLKEQEKMNWANVKEIIKC